MNKMTKSIITAAFSVAALSLTACANTSLHPTNAQKPVQELSGNWQITALTGEPTPNNKSRLSFDASNHTYQAYFGCNHFNGSYEIKQQQLKLGTAAGTMMMCENIEDERTGTGTLQFVRQWRIVNQDNKTQLQLLDEQNRVRVTAIPAK